MSRRPSPVPILGALVASVLPRIASAQGLVAPSAPRFDEPAAELGSPSPAVASDTPVAGRARPDSATNGAGSSPGAPAPDTGFTFGSYGRVSASTDLRGRRGREANVVAHGTRVDESTYAELELRRDDQFGAVHARIVSTLAVQGPLFHENGTFDASLAVRNLYVETTGALHPRLALWMGSRMYRGDDAYLLNWWPLDNLNTVGAGARLDVNNHLTVAFHGGFNRLDTRYQYQTVQAPPVDGFGATRVVLLDRPRFIASLKGTYWLLGRSAPAGVKLALYGEAHMLPSGTQRNPDNGRLEPLDPDGGFVVGAQVGVYTGQRATHVNLWFRYAQGLAAYGDLAAPYTLTAQQTSARARDIVLAAAGNWERGALAVVGAAYVRYFHDADPSVFGRNQSWEGTVVLRPTVWFGLHSGLAVEGSFQSVVYDMLDPVTGLGPRTASLWRFAVIPFVSPMGRGTYTRPHLRAIYALTLRDDGARRLYAPADPFASNAVEHFVGLGCEWWFNSSYR